MSRVLITGGAGFIGSHVAESLLAAGHEVRVYDSLVEQVHGGRGPVNVPDEAEFVLGDVRDSGALRRALRGVDAIVHHAAEVGVGQSMYQISRYVDGNTGGTGVLLELLANERHQVERIVVASSMSVYGEGAYRCEQHGVVHPRPRGDLQLGARDWDMRCPECTQRVSPVPTPESKPLQPASIYAISKLDQELMCLAVGRAYDIGVVALRYFNTYGPRQALSNPYTGVAAIFSSRLMNGQPALVFEDGAQLRDFVHVQDVARGDRARARVTRCGGRGDQYRHRPPGLGARRGRGARAAHRRRVPRRPERDVAVGRHPPLLGRRPQGACAARLRAGGELRRRHARAGRLGTRAGGRRSLRSRARRAAAARTGSVTPPR